jgi:hypothetical protein
MKDLSSLPPEPERWSDRPGRGAGAENAVGATFRRVRQATLPTDQAMARMAWRSGRPRSAPVFGVRHVVAAIVVLLCMAGAVGAARSIVHRAREARDLRAADRVTAREKVSPSARLRSPSASPPAEATAPDTATAPANQDATGLGAAASQRPRPTEAALLAEAFRAVRARGNGAAALRSLDRYDRLFPAGILRGEVRIARVEALLALGRRGEALPLLKGIEDAGAVLTRNVRIARAEMLVEEGSCASALVDFADLLASPEADDAAGRALYGRASCSLRAGDVAAGRRDLERYVSLFPAGTLAARARAALDRSP